MQTAKKIETPATEPQLVLELGSIDIHVSSRLTSKLRGKLVDGRVEYSVDMHEGRGPLLHSTPIAREDAAILLEMMSLQQRTGWR